MRRALALCVLSMVCIPLIAQSRARPRPPRFFPQESARAEALIKETIEQMGEEKKRLERDLRILEELRLADEALVDNMQPSAAIQSAYEHVDEANRLEPEFLVRQGVLKALGQLSDARRSPATADFGRLRMTLRDDALGPASRLAVRNATRLQEEALAWMKVQELIAMHLRTLTEITGESLRAAQRE